MKMKMRKKNKKRLSPLFSILVLCPIWVRVCYNRFIAESIIDYLILASIKQISAEMQPYSIILIWKIRHLLSKSDYRKSYIRVWANHLLVLWMEIGVKLFIIGFKFKCSDWFTKIFQSLWLWLICIPKNSLVSLRL